MNDAKSWKIIMDDEMTTLKNNYTWYLIPFPKGRKPVG
jgi:hypothetical protein